MLDLSSNIKNKIEKCISQAVGTQAIEIELLTATQERARLRVQSQLIVNVESNYSRADGRHGNQEGAEYATYAQFDEKVNQLSNTIINDSDLHCRALSHVTSLGFGAIKSKYHYCTYPKSVYNQYQCSSCGGSGRLNCPDCHGSGRSSCYGCGGSGKQNCSSCGGDGRVQQTRMVYDDRYVGHSVVEYVSCNSCYSGRVTCNVCGGAGNVSCNNCRSLDHTVSCGSCSGTGYHSQWTTFDIYFEPAYKLEQFSEITSDKLDEILQKVSLSSLLEHCSAERFDSTTRLEKDNSIVTKANFEIPYYHGSFRLKEKSDKTYDYLLFGKDMYVVSLDHVMDTFIVNALEQALKTIKIEGVKQSDFLTAKHHWQEINKLYLVRSMTDEYLALNSNDKKDKVSLTERFYSKNSNLISKEVAGKIVDFCSMSEDSVHSYFYAKYGKKIIAVTLVLASLGWFLTDSYLVSLLIIFASATVFWTARKKFNKQSLQHDKS